MVALTPEIAGTSIIFMLVSYVVVIAFSLYQLYLNWKQAKVQKTTQGMLEESRKQTWLLKKSVEFKTKKQILWMDLEKVGKGELPDG
jgi:hypothetical protein